MSSGVPDKRFAEYVLKSKLVTPAQLEEARRSQDAALSIGTTMSLAEALVRMKALTSSQRGVIEKRLTTQSSSGIQRLGQYRLLRRVGSGAMGVVYLAEDTMAQRQVALKVLARELVKNPSFLERFHREAVASGKLNHANLITAFSFGEDRGWRYYVMEFCPGESAEQSLEQRGPFPWAQALRIARDAAQGLHYAHQHGIIHRDVKPGNIMVTPEGVGRVLDMGLLLERLRPDDRQGGTVGTPHYISPEQARGAKSLDGRADIYSLGATVFHMVTGRPPYTGDDGIAVMKKHLSEPVPDPAKYRDVPERVTRILQRAMAKDPDERYGDCAELIADLDLALVSEEPASGIAAKTSPVGAGRGTSPHRRGSPASVWGDESDAAVRPAQSRGGAPGEAHRAHRSRHGSEYDPLPPRSRSRRNSWLYPVIGASVLLLMVVVLLVVMSGGEDEGRKSANETPKKKSSQPEIPPPGPDGKSKEDSGKKDDGPPPPPPVPSPPPTADIDGESRWQDAIDLMRIADLTADPVQGWWGFQGQELLNAATPRARMGLGYRPPEEYDFRIVFTRKTGAEVTQIIKWKGNGIAWVLGAIGNTASGFLRTNTELTPPFRSEESRGLEDGKQHSTIIEVRKDRIRGYLDGELLSEWSGDSKELTWHPGWDLPKALPLGLGSHNAELVLHAVQIREVSGKGKLLRRASPLTGPGGVTAEWKAALAALPPESQLKHVNVKLQQVNPGYTGQVSMWVDEGQLKFINLQRATIRNLTPLQGLPYLNGIGLGGDRESPCTASDLSNLTGLRLAYVDCSYSRVTSLRPLEGMKITQLVCHHTGVADLAPLKGAPLEKLDCSRTKVGDLSPLKGAPLVELKCSNTEVRDLSPLKGMRLSVLNVAETRVSSLAPLAGMPLKELNVSETRVADVRPISRLKLRTLRISDVGLKNLNFLKGMPVEQLSVSGNGIKDISVLAGLPLTELWLSHNPVSNLQPLRGKSLRLLYLRDTGVTSVKDLAGMPLESLDIRGLKLESTAPLRPLPLVNLLVDYDPGQHYRLIRNSKTLKRVNGYEVDTFLEMQPKKKN